MFKIVVASEARDLLLDAINFQCDTPWSSFHMYKKSTGWGGASRFLSANSSQTAKNFKKLKTQDESR